MRKRVEFPQDDSRHDEERRDPCPRVCALRSALPVYGEWNQSIFAVLPPDASAHG